VPLATPGRTAHARHVAIVNVPEQQLRSSPTTASRTACSSTRRRTISSVAIAAAPAAATVPMGLGMSRGTQAFPTDQAAYAYQAPGRGHAPRVVAIIGPSLVVGPRGRGLGLHVGGHPRRGAVKNSIRLPLMLGIMLFCSPAFCAEPHRHEPTSINRERAIRRSSAVRLAARPRRKLQPHKLLSARGRTRRNRHVAWRRKSNPVITPAAHRRGRCTLRPNASTCRTGDRSTGTSPRSFATVGCDDRDGGA